MRDQAHDVGVHELSSCRDLQEQALVFDGVCDNVFCHLQGVRHTDVVGEQKQCKELSITFCETLESCTSPQPVRLMATAGCNRTFRAASVSCHLAWNTVPKAAQKMAEGHMLVHKMAVRVASVSVCCEQ